VAEIVGHCVLASDRCGWEELLVLGFDDLEEAGNSQAFCHRFTD
jgi:hypothetical protein